MEICCFGYFLRGHYLQSFKGLPEKARRVRDSGQQAARMHVPVEEKREKVTLSFVLESVNA